MYQLIKPLLFWFDPEKVHYFVTRNLKRFNRFPGGAKLSRLFWDIQDTRLEKEVFGLKFKNHVGLAAVNVRKLTIFGVFDCHHRPVALESLTCQHLKPLK